MKAGIIGGGYIDDYADLGARLKDCDLIICADGGIRHLIEIDVPPDVFIGDFDSCNRDIAEKSVNLENTKIYSHNPIKDDTDMQLCIDYALNNGCDEIVVFAALGGRIDHELSNILNLKYILDKGAKGIIYSKYNEIYITDNNIIIPKKDGFKISVIPLTPIASGVDIKGTYYPLENGEISQGTSLGISNEFISEYADISVKNGVLLVIVSKDTLNI